MDTQGIIHTIKFWIGSQASLYEFIYSSWLLHGGRINEISNEKLTFVIPDVDDRKMPEIMTAIFDNLTFTLVYSCKKISSSEIEIIIPIEMRDFIKPYFLPDEKKYEYRSPDWRRVVGG